VSLEPKGLRLIALHAPDSERIYGEIARRFGDERVRQLFTLLHELQESIEDLAHEDESMLPRSSRKTAARAHEPHEGGG